MSTSTAQNIEDIYPLSPLQQGMLFHSLLDRESGVYLMQDRYRLAGRLDEDALARAWKLVVAAYPALRTSFLWKTQKQPLQVVHRSVELDVERIDLRGRAATDQEAAIRALLEREQQSGFNLARPPLIRFRLVRLADESYELIRSFHHILMDAWCISIIMVDFLRAYEALRAGRELHIQRTRPYRDYIQWLRAQDPARSEAFWRAQLAGLTAPTPFGIDRGQRRDRYTSAVLVDDVSLELAERDTERLAAFCRDHRLTPNTFFQGAWALLLARYSGHREVIFGTTVSGRPPGLPGVEEMIGLFINTLPLRVAVPDDAPLLSWLDGIQTRNVDLREYEHTPLVDIQGYSEFPRGESLFDSILVYENALVDESVLRGDLSFRLEGMDHSVHTHYGLTVVVMPGARLGLRISYDRARFERPAMERMLGHLVALATEMAAAPETRIGELAMSSEAERQQIAAWNQTETAFPLDRTYAALFADRVAHHPQRIAAVCDGESFTYAELDRRSNRIAHALIAAGAGPEVVVAVIGERGLALLTMMVAVLKTGAAYVPVDVNHPAARVSEIVALSGASIVSGSERVRPLVDAVRASVSGTSVSGTRPMRCVWTESEWLSGDSSAPPLSGGPDNLAYVIFTSGSSGTPKGVMVEQRGMLNNIFGKVPGLGLSDGDRIAQTASPAFDISVWQFLAAPLVGATVHILPDRIAHDPEALVAAIERERITLLEAVPAVIRGMLDARNSESEMAPASEFRLASLRWLIPTGEALPPALCRDWLARFPHVPLMNAYGPAECSDDVAFHAVREPADAECAVMPIGRPTANNRLYIVDAALRPVPIGVVGEIGVAGVGVGRGYVGDPDRTRAVFVDNPFTPGTRFYLTGDLGRWREDGVIEFLGRRDQQVKVRGHRIELGEIESRLERHPAVEVAAVVAARDERGETRLIGYWQASAGATASAAELASYLGGELPGYMVPSALVEVAELPLSANGKVDRKALTARAAEERAGGERVYEAPRTASESAIAAIWGEVLGVERVGVDDNFFALGGHSLLATQVMSRVRARVGADLPLRALFEHSTVAGLSRAVDVALGAVGGLTSHSNAVDAKNASPGATLAIDRQARGERVPLSFAQQRLWFLEQLAGSGSSGLYVIPFALRLRGAVDIEALRRSFELLIERHEVLRTAIVSEHGEPWQEVRPATRFELPIVETSDASGAAELAAVFAAPFDLAEPPLVRAQLIRLGTAEHILAVAIHHLVSDAWSATLAIRELAAAYGAFARGSVPESPELPIQYADLAIWQRAQGAGLEQQLAYWKEALGKPSADGEAPSYVLELPTDRARPAVQSYRAGSASMRLSPERSAQMQQFAIAHRVSPFAVVFTAFAVLLQRITGRRDLLIGTPSSNRQRAETESLLGVLLNNLVIRADLSDGPAFAELARRVGDALVEAQRNQDLPFEQLVDALAVTRSLAHAPLFQVMVAQQLSIESRVQLAGLSLEVIDTPMAHTECDLDLHVVCPPQGEVQLELLYAADLFEHATAERTLARLAHVLGELLSRPAERVVEQTCVLPDEATQMAAWNATAKSYPGPHTLAEALTEQLARTPESPAVRFGDEVLTYRALHEQANRVAHALRTADVGRESIVAVCMERSIELVVALVGIAKAGAAYLPIDPELPAARVEYMLRDAAAPLVLTQEHLRTRLPADAIAHEISGQWLADFDGAAPPRVNVAPMDLAYVIYTSGSTGQPKGVLTEQGALLNRLWWMQDEFALDGRDRVLQKTPYSFDVSVWEFFWPLITGAELVMAKPEGHRDSGYLIEAIQRYGITTLHFVPSMLQAFVTEPGLAACTSLRQVFASGEALSVTLMEQFQARHPAALVNLYGPTEAAIDVSMWRCERGAQRVPIGRPIANVALHVLDAAQRPLPIGAAGELYIGGVAPARGYLNRPELTAERFVADPFTAGQRLYRTGDRCRLLPDGTIEYLGRFDDQVKLRGQRIELGEIEAQIRAFPAIRDAAVILRDDDANPQIVAYVVPTIGTVDESALRAHLARELPAYMVPAAIVELSALPLSAHGKLDRKALPAPASVAPDASTPPRGDIEGAMAALWADVLRVPVESIGRDSNFFTLGGHSLLATVLLARMRERFGAAPGLRDLFERPTIEGLAARLPASSATSIAIVPQPRGDRLPLSHAQERLWFLSKLTPDSAEYNITAGLELRGAVDIARLQSALSSVLDRHEILRSRIVESGDGPEVVVDAASELELPFDTVDADSDEDWQSIVNERAAALAGLPFDLARDRLIRANLVCRRGREQRVLFVVIHHAVADLWSMQILFGELSAAYRTDASAALETLPIQYVDYAIWQRAAAQRERNARQLAYWRDLLEDGDYVLELSTDGVRAHAVTDRAAGAAALVLPPPLVQAARAYAAARGTTVYTVLLAALDVLLARHTGQRDVRVGTAVANRELGETQRLIGCFVNTLVIRADVDPAQSFDALLAQVTERVVAAQEHQDVPFEQVVEALAPARDLGRTPLFQVLFVMQQARIDAAAWPGVEVHEVAVPPAAAKFDLNWEVHDDGDRLAVRLEYRRSLFEPTTMARYLAQWEVILEQITATPAIAIGEIAVATPAERAQMAAWNATARPYPGPHTLAEALAEQLARSPEAPAVRFGDEAITYRALHEQANRVAHALRAVGVGRESIVAVCMERSIELVVALVGIAKAGAAYLPIDPELPAARIEYMLRDAASPLVLTQKHLRTRLPADVTAREISGDWLADFDGAVPPRVNAAPTDLAYVIYTSGSTGQPKGVLTEQGALLNRLWWMQDEFALDGRDRVLQKTPYSFDVSVWEFFWPLITGAELVMAKPEGHRDSGYLIEAIQGHGITTLHFVPSMLQAFVTEPGLAACTSLRQVFASGEALSVTLMEQFQARHPAALVNLYGPTEAAIDVSMWRCERGAQRVPIGRPIANVTLHVLDPAARRLPIGAVGELYIGGVAPARGYLNRPELTAERFVADPFTAGQRLYRTGDRCRFLADGTIEYLGRFDDQVKLRGQRIELGEIEAQIRAFPAIRDAAVILRDDDANPRIVAYVVAAIDTVDDSALRAHLARELPPYMVPAAIVELSALPLSAHGKLDRKALPAPPAAAQDPFEPPQGELEAAIAAIWAEVLQMPATDVGRRSHFFRLGGHSLLATVVLARMRERLGAAPTLRQLFDHPTLGALAAVLPVAATAATPAITGGDRPARLPLSHAQERLWFLSKLSPESAEYNIVSALELRGPLDETALQRALSAVVARHEVLRTRIVENAGAEIAIDPPGELPLGVESVDADEDATWSGIVAAQANEEAHRPFDLARDRLIRARLIRRAGTQERLLLLAVHHIVADDWSMNLLADELARQYRAEIGDRDAALPPLPIQYADYAIWQRAQSARHAAQLAYWRATLDGGEPILDLPTDHPRGALISAAAGAEHHALSPDLTERVRRLAHDRGTTPYTVLLAAAQLLLARYSGQRDVRVGTAVANRELGETQRLIGCFVNTLVIRADVDPAQPFDALLAQVAERVVAAQEHQDVPFEQVVEALAPARDLAQTPLFQVLFVMQHARIEAAAWPGVEVREVAVPPAAAKFDLNWEVHDDGERVAVRLEYRRGLFEPATMARYLAQWEAILEQITATPAIAIGEIAVATPVERAQMAAWNATAKSYPGPHTLAEALAEQLARTPESPAVRFGEAVITYRALHEQANRVAHALRTAGAGRESIVAVCMERSIELVVALVGIANAGAAYLPIDPELPAARIDYMLRDAAAPLVLTQEHLRARLPAGVTARELGGEWLAGFDGAVPPHVDPAPTDLAYVIYTSGSTGQPKGVLTEQGALLNRLWWMQDEFVLDGRDRVLQKTPYSFDVSVWEFFWPLITGAELVMAKPEGHRDSGYLIEAIQRHGITTLHFVPSMLQAFVTEPGLAACTSLRQVFASGEALSVTLMEQFQARHPAALVNLYGPTEAAIDVSMWRCKRGAQRVPVGRPIANVALHVLDAAQRPLPIGAAGELYIGGVAPARGYLNRPELTAERFLADPFSAGQRLYRTGDRCRLLADGTIEYLGRFDDQVKLRGQRIELGEIEAQIRAFSAVRDAAVILRDDGANPQIVAYIVPADGTVDESALRAHLARELPAYMVPTAIVELSSLPLSTHGKLDRKALPAPVAAPAATYVAPSTEAEVILCDIVAALVRRERVGVEDNFFALGGDSILGLQVVARARERGVALTPKQLFQERTIGGLARVAGRSTAALAEQGVLAGDVPLLPIQRWFLDEHETPPGHWNQSVLLRPSAPLNAAHVRAALAHVAAQHDALRLRWTRAAGRWQQRYAPDLDAFAFDELTLLSGDDLAACLAPAAASLDLESGPIACAVLVRIPDGQRLYLAIHHLAIDAVSWRILLDDFARAYRQIAAGGAPEASPKSTSYRQWAARIVRYADSPATRAQLAYWRSRTGPRLPVEDAAAPNLAGDEVALAETLSRDDTRALLEQARRAYRTQPHELLLAALALVAAEWTASDAVAIDVEQHGRAPLFPELDASRTVGWFTSLYPVRCELPAGVGAAIRAVKETLRAVPEHGLGYGALRYAAGAALPPSAGVLFNYLGGVDAGDAGMLALAPEPGPRDRAAGSRRSHELEVVAFVTGGALRIEWRTSARRISRATSERWLARFAARLREVLQHCLDPHAGGVTPSDFPLAKKLDQRSLDAVLRKLGGAKGPK